MSGPGKTLVIIVAVVVVVAAGVGIFLLTNLDSITRTVIETVGSRVTGSEVRVGSVSLSLRDGTGSISRLRIANPAGFGEGDAIEVGEVSLKVALDSLRGDVVTVQSLVVDGARVNAVQTTAGNNLQALLDRVRRNAGDGGGNGGQSTVEGEDTRLIIDEFRFTNAVVSASVPGLGQERTARVPDVVLKDIGRASGGVTAAQAARQLLDPLIRQSMQAATGLSVEDLKGRAREEMDSALEEGAQKLGDRLREKLGR